jgi:hypothetical protein
LWARNTILRYQTKKFRVYLYDRVKIKVKSENEVKTDFSNCIHPTATKLEKLFDFILLLLSFFLLTGFYTAINLLLSLVIGFFD